MYAVVQRLNIYSMISDSKSQAIPDFELSLTEKRCEVNFYYTLMWREGQPQIESAAALSDYMT